MSQPSLFGDGAFAIDAAHLMRQREFSRRTFGPGMRTKGVIDHIRKELAEIEADPGDVNEWVDVIILALDGAWRCGAEPQVILDAVNAKQTRNELRVWPDWRTASEDEAIEHDRTHDAPPVHSAPARNTDPDTSHGAARTETDVGRFTAKSRKAQLLTEYARHDAAANGLTDQDAAVRVLGWPVAASKLDGCRRRCSELREVGFITDSGRRRRNRGSDVDSIVSTITETGRLALRRLAETGWSKP